MPVPEVSTLEKYMRVMLRTRTKMEAWMQASKDVKDKSTHMVSGIMVMGSVITHLCPPPLSTTPSATPPASVPASMTSDQASSLSKEPLVSLLPPL